MNTNAIALDARGEIRKDMPSSAYKVGDEFKPFHPSASHVSPEWRDGWNACFVAAIAALQAEPQPEQTASISLGPVAFEFAHFQQWVNKASTWFRALQEANSNAAQRRYLCIDAAGRVCMIGRDFSRARDEGKFPVRVHLIDALPATTPKD